MVAALDDYVDPITAPVQPAGNLSALVTGQPLPDPQVGYTEDIVKGIGGGLGRGVTGLIGLPGTIGGLAHAGASKLGISDENINRIATGLNAALPFTSAFRAPDASQVKEAVEGVTGKFYEPQTIPGQYASTIAEYAPAAFIPGGGGAIARVVNTVVPAVASETAGQLTKGTSAEPWARGVAGLAAGVAVPKLITPAAPASAARQAAVQTLDEAGIPLTAGQRTGSKPLQWMESNAADTPFAAGRAREINANQAAAYDKAVTERVFDRPALTARGVPEDVNLPDPRVVVAGRKSLSDEYNRLSANNSLKSDPLLMQELHDAENYYVKNTIKSERTGHIEEIRNDIVNELLKNKGVMSGAEYQVQRSRIGNLAHDKQGNTPLSNALNRMQTALDGAMIRNLSPDDVTAWSRTNTMWGRMKQLKGAMATDSENLNLSPAAVAQSAKSGRLEQYARQANDLDTLARAGAQVLKPLPQSGTGPRQMAQSFATGGAGGWVGSLLGGFPGMVVGALAPSAYARALLSRPVQGYLGNTVLPQNARDVVAQALTQQAITQPSIVTRNRADWDEYQKNRRDILEPQ